MPKVIELKNGKCETLFNEQHMGYEAADYFRSLMEELDRYREEDKQYG